MAAPKQKPEPDQEMVRVELLSHYSHWDGVGYVRGDVFEVPRPVADMWFRMRECDGEAFGAKPSKAALTKK